MSLSNQVVQIILKKRICLFFKLAALLVIANLLCTHCFAQVVRSTIPSTMIGSLSLNTNVTWLDNYYRQKISDTVQIVGIGEVSHGAIEPMDFQTKMIQYLVERRGYRNILFERSDFYAIRPIRNYLNNIQLKNDTIEKWAKTGGFTSAAAENFLKLLRWLKIYNLNHPDDQVQIAGFDLSNEPTFFNYVLNHYIIPLNPSQGGEYTYLLNDVSDTTKIQRIRTWFDINRDSIQDKFKDAETGWLNFHLRNLESGAKAFKLKGIDSKSWTLYRDSMMSENVMYLSQSKKTVIIAHNGHIVRTDDGYMGTYLNKNYRTHYYVILTDFSRKATVEISNMTKQAEDKTGFSTKAFLPHPTSAAAEILAKYQIASGIFQYKDIVSNRVLDRTNAIDAYGVQLLTPAHKRAFDSLVVFENLTPGQIGPQ
jgi:erythromycin esterase-like protein